MDLDELRFSPEHIWVRLNDDQQATIGLAEEAFQDQEEIAKVRLPVEGEEFIKDETFGRVTTSRPAILRLYAPISGEVVEVNDDILDAPEMILEDPYEEGWLLRLEISNLSEYDDLMTEEEYNDFLGVASPDDDPDLDDDEEDEDF